MIPRHIASTLAQLVRGYPVLVVTGPRQSGKTTLVRALFADRPYVSLEQPDEREFAREDPRGFLARFPKGAVIDEAQHVPPLFSYIQSRVDDSGRMGEFVLTGSQNFQLLASISQSLAGRAAIVELLPFAVGELRDAGQLPTDVDQLLYQGLYPPLYVRELEPYSWYGNYALTYLERDVRQLANVHDLALFQRFIRLCAARTGQMLNMAALANECGIAASTVRHWLSILETSYIVHLLRPHHANFGKRLVKTPKLYFHDTGLVAQLLGIRSAEQLRLHPVRPALFETLVVNEYLKQRFNAGHASDLWFWRDSTGNEVDILIDEGGRLRPVEVKSGQTITDEALRGLRRWSDFAGAHAGPATLVYGGDQSYGRSGVQVLGWRAL